MERVTLFLKVSSGELKIELWKESQRENLRATETQDTAEKPLQILTLKTYK